MIDHCIDAWVITRYRLKHGDCRRPEIPKGTRGFVLHRLLPGLVVVDFGVYGRVRVNPNVLTKNDDSA